MNVDIRKVIGIAPNCLDNPKLLRSVMGDLYPESKRDINIIMNVYECGIPLSIKSKKSVSTIEYSQYVKRIIDEYGIQEIYVGEAIDAWINAILGDGIAEKCRPQNVSYEAEVRKSSSGVKNNLKSAESTEDAIVPKVSNAGADVKLFEFKETDDGYSITNYIGFDTKVIIPDLYNGKPVNTIDVEAFAKCRDIKEVILGNNIKTIGGSAFTQCEELEAVYNFENVSYVGGGAFSSCKKLSKINITDSITFMGTYAFSATSIKYFKVPEKIVNLQMGVVSNCLQLEKVVIHDNVKTIGSGCFQNCKKLVELTIPASVERVRDKLIEGSTSIERLCIESDDLIITDQAFFVKPYYKDLTIYCHAGSTAQTYCRKYDVKCMPLT